MENLFDDHFKVYKNELSKSRFLSFECFKKLLIDLFTDYKNDNESAQYLFNLFDQNKNGQLDEKEVDYMWTNWIDKLLKLKFALVVIDMQNDFISGSLTVENGADCVSIINRLIRSVKFDKLVFTLDWHPDDHISFFKNLKNFEIYEVNDNREFNRNTIKMFDKVKFKIDEMMVEQILWPVHCVQNSEGSKLHKDLIQIAESNHSSDLNDDKNSIQNNSIMIFKGKSRECDSYSAFFDNLKINQTELDDQLKKNKIDVLFISGLAIDYCVGETVKDALHLGYLTVLIEDACKGINQKRIESTKLELKNKGCIFVSSEQVENMVNLKVRNFQIGLQLAKKIMKN